MYNTLQSTCIAAAVGRRDGKYSPSKNNFKQEVTGHGETLESYATGRRGLIKICLHNRILQGFSFHAACREHAFIKLRFCIFFLPSLVISFGVKTNNNNNRGKKHETGIHTIAAELLRAQRRKTKITI